MIRTLRVGTRGSALALWQTNHVVDRLKALHPGLVCEVVIIKTHGDKILDVPLARIGDRGLFVKEIEEALFREEIDLAVHSLKDLPTTQPDGLGIAAVSERADPRDCVVSPRYGAIAALPERAVIGTSSLRRKAQLRAAHAGWTFKDVRGNLQTRLAKLDAGEYDALVLAAAGLERLGLGDRITERLPFELSLPAVGQGALAIETRAYDKETLELVEPLDHARTRACVTAERTLMAELEGGCQVPIAAHARWEGEQIVMDALVASLEGDSIIRTRVTGTDPEQLGKNAAAALVVQGSETILAAIRSTPLP